MKMLGSCPLGRGTVQEVTEIKLDCILRNTQIRNFSSLNDPVQ